MSKRNVTSERGQPPTAGRLRTAQTAQTAQTPQKPQTAQTPQKPQTAQKAIHRPHGLWKSSITAAVFGRGMSFGDVRWTSAHSFAAQGVSGGQSPRLVWVEHREGRGTIVVSDGWDAPTEVTVERNVRARLGYGGGEFTTTTDDVFFVADGRLHRQSLTAGAASAITPAFGQASSPTVSADGRFVAYVHSVDRNDCIAVVDAAGRMWPQKLVDGDDFYMQPAWHPDGRRLAFIAWNHPQMPWDGTELFIARLRHDAPEQQHGEDAESDGAVLLPTVESVDVVAGGSDVSVLQPEFSPDGRYLAYVSDETGRWQLYVYDLETGRHRQLTDAPYEHGRPAWVQGIRTYAFAPDGRSIYYIRNEEGFHHVWCCHLRGDAPSGAAVGGGERAVEPGVDTQDERTELSPINVRVPSVFDEYTVLEQITVASVPGDAGSVDIACIASAPAIPPRIVVGRVQMARRFEGDSEGGSESSGEGGRESDNDGRRAGGSGGVGRCTVIRRSQTEQFEPGLLSMPKSVQWEAEDGTAVYGLYYAPANPRCTADGLPPALISIHGGPTSQALPEFNPKAQFYTSRGYVFLDVNYRGSTGYGRAYRDQLKGRWGIVDVEDAVGGAKYLAEQGLADPERLVILGGSAGGYTVLRALITHPGFFRAGICLFGVSDLFGLAADTHKFEERYTDSLVGPLPEAAALYRELSPVFHAERLRDPLAIFQGTDDEVVPREQSDKIVAALRARGVPHEYHVYEGEGHGFRRPETIEAFYAAVESFLRTYVVFA